MIITLAALAVFFAADLIVTGRKPHVPSTKECLLHIGFFIAAALIFGGLIWICAGPKPAVEFYSGWLTEYSLSVDNLFIFVIIMSNFAVPRQMQKYVLGVGITLALVLRGIFILLGAAIVTRFTWVFLFFGVFLIYTAVSLLHGDSGDDEYKENRIIRFLRKVMKLTDEYDGRRLRTVKGGVRYFTPMLIVFIAIGTTDVMFAFEFYPCDFRSDEGPFYRFHNKCFCPPGAAAAVFPPGFASGQTGLPAHWAVCRFRVYRHQTDHGSPSRQYFAVHQRGKGDIVHTGYPYMGLSGCYHRFPGNCCSGQPYEGTCARDRERKVSSSCAPPM